MSAIETLKIDEILDSLHSGDRSLFNSLSASEQQWIHTILEELADTGDSPSLSALWHIDFDEQPVTIDDFLEDPYYLGAIGGNIYPIWRDELRYVLDPKNEIFEWVFAGAIGVGKTTIGLLATLYKMYWLSCLRDPQAYYGLIPNSQIVFGLFSILKYLANDTSYQNMVNYAELSPWFKRYMDPTKKSSHIGFPKKISFAIGSDAIHALGQNVFGGMLDEANFGKLPKNSDEKSQVARLYDATRERMKSRFMDTSGRVPGLMCLISSARDQEDFLEKHIEERMSDPHVHISRYARWEVKDIWDDQPRFHVFTGTSISRPKILEPEEINDYDPGRVIAAPLAFRDSAEMDIYVFLRDAAGVPTHGYDKFVSRRDIVLGHVNKERTHPFTQDTIQIGLKCSNELSDFLIKEQLVRLYDETRMTYKPAHFPEAPRFVHVDLSKNGDCTGITSGCISGIQRVQRRDKELQTYTTTDLKVWIDFMVRVKALPDDEIDFSKIRNFIYWMSNNGFTIGGVSYDGFQSVDSIQQLTKDGFKASTVSVDRSKEPYGMLRRGLYEGRVDVYGFPPVFHPTDGELFKLLDTGKKIDHPPLGSKDVTDSMAGMVWNLLSAKGSEHQHLAPDAAFLPAEEMAEASRIRQELPIDMSWVTGGKVNRVNPLQKLFD